MPYKDIKELPKNLDVLPTRGKKIWLKVFNESLAKYGETTARKIAWTAIKNVYQLDKNGDWKEKEELKSLSFYITRANLDKEGKMVFLATASDTNPDLYQECMSLDLYQSFIDKFTGNEYISLSHYSELNGKGVLGKIEKIFIDRERLKIKGYFEENKLGIAAFNSIKKDRRNNIPEDQRVRLSIGFYDRKHQHEGFIWESQSNKPCLKCAMGFKKDKVYLDGIMIHAALTRIPICPRATFDYVDKI